MLLKIHSIQALSDPSLPVGAEELLMFDDTQGEPGFFDRTVIGMYLSFYFYFNFCNKGFSN